MYTRRVCRLCRGTYITGVNSKGEDPSQRNILIFETSMGFFPREQISFDICHDCYEDFLKRIMGTDQYIRKHLSDIDGNIAKEYDMEPKDFKKGLPKNEK